MRQALEALESLLDTAGAGDGMSPVLELVTVDGEGFPFCCLLSCRQIVVRAGAPAGGEPGANVLALLRGSRPNAHLASNGLATLSFVADDAHGMLRLKAA